jgi:hypothetical protein
MFVESWFAISCVLHSFDFLIPPGHGVANDRASQADGTTVALPARWRMTVGFGKSTLWGQAI